MGRAFNIMKVSNKYLNRNFKINSKLYESLKLSYKLKLSVSMSGENNPMFGVESPFKGRKHTESTLELQSSIKKGELNPRYGVEVTSETRKRLSESRLGHEVSINTRSKISESLKNLPTRQCPYCLNNYKPAAYGRSHGEKCKQRGFND